MWELTAKKGVAVPATWSCRQKKMREKETEVCLKKPEEKTQKVYLMDREKFTLPLSAEPKHFFFKSAKTLVLCDSKFTDKMLIHSLLHTSFKP